MHKWISATAIAIAGVTSPAFAQDGWYARIDAGYAFAGGLETPEELGFTPQFGGDGEVESGWVGALAAGRAFSSGLRLEGELALRGGDIESSDGIAPGADANVSSAMLNAAYDFNSSGALRPYVGLGVGMAQVEAQVFNNATLIADLVGFDDSDTVVAYQAFAGVGFALDESLTLDVGYRYFAAPELEFSGQGPLAAPRSFSADYDQHAVTVGVRWSFAN